MKKFTVIVTHYNQIKYIKESILSVLNQDYKNIELIISDDGSKEFDKSKVEKLIKENNKNNFEYNIIDNKINQGTVKNINGAVKKAKGDYILFFAADDKLYDNKIVSRFVKEFEDETKNVITTQCLLYDKDLKKLYGKFVNKNKALKLNTKDSRTMYAQMAMGCIYGSGGTAYRKEVFKKYGYYDEKYPFVEDWSYWLKILREGEKIYYSNFKTLCHRDGGISHSEYTGDTLQKHVKQYYYDILNIYVNEIFPYMDRFSLIEKYKILSVYQRTTYYYASFVPQMKEYINYLRDFRNNDKKFSILWDFMVLFKNFKNFVLIPFIGLFKYNKKTLITLILWLISNILINNNIVLKNRYLYGLIYLFDYFIIYSLVYILYNSLKFIKYRKEGGLNV